MPTKARTAAKRRPLVEHVPLADRLSWSVPQFAAVNRWSDAYIYERLHPDDTGLNGTIRLPGGVTVPCHRDHSSGDWTIYRARALQAMGRQP